MMQERRVAKESRGDIILAFALALLLVCMVMASLYESLFHPFVIMFTVVFSSIGIIMLAGVVVNHGIILVDYTNQLRDGGSSVREALLAGRFAAPTSAGVLFAMLAAAGLSATWLFAKACILAIFDDLDTVLLMIPLQMLIVGLAWQLGVVVVLMGALLWIAWSYLHRCPLPVTWPWVLTYAAGITALSELLATASYRLDDTVLVHVEVLLPAFVLGCILARPPRQRPPPRRRCGG
jgi:hypothetical protein